MSGSQGTAKVGTSAVSHSSSVPKKVLHFAGSRSLLQIALFEPHSRHGKPWTQRGSVP